MEKFSKDFMLGAATAAHQVEGNNIHNDCWLMENLPDSDYAEPSLDAVDHYNRYEEDIKILADAGLNAYRFSIEWARIEPEEGKFDESEIEHYRKVLECCKANGVAPIVTMHHFSSPVWLITKGGWECEELPELFTRYCTYVVEKLGEYMEYVCTINEANMGIQIAAVARAFMKRMGLQVGMDFQMPEEMLKKQVAQAQAFGLDNPADMHQFLSVRSEHSDELLVQAHEMARDAMKAKCPHLKVGLTLSLFDIQTIEGGEEIAAKEWEEDFSHYVPALLKDDFIGVQNYSRKIVGPEGDEDVPEGAELTQMEYEFYPEGIGHVIRRVYAETKKDIIVTENGIATADDSRRVEYINRAIAGVMGCIEDGIPVKGYTHWSLLDNFEWQKGFGMTFGLIAVDRKTQTRYPKESIKVLGSYRSAE